MKKRFVSRFGADLGAELVREKAEEAGGTDGVRQAKQLSAWAGISGRSPAKEGHDRPIIGSAGDNPRA